MLLTEKEARTICEKMLSYVKADDAAVSVNSGTTCFAVAHAAASAGL